MTAVNPYLLWVVLTVAGVAVGGAVLWIAFAAVNKRQGEQRQGFEVKETTSGGESGVLREKETNHG